MGHDGKLSTTTIIRNVILCLKDYEPNTYQWWLMELVETVVVLVVVRYMPEVDKAFLELGSEVDTSWSSHSQNHIRVPLALKDTYCLPF